MMEKSKPYASSEMKIGRKRVKMKLESKLKVKG